MNIKSYPVDYEKLEAALHKRGVTMSMVSREIGRSDSYIKVAARRGRLQTTAAQLIEVKYNIKPEEYAPIVPHEAETVESGEAFSAEELEKIVRQAVAEEVGNALKETISAMTRQELVNMMRSTMTTALRDFHNTTIMMERMEKGTKKWQD